jgi:hypothetical protein
MQSDALEVLTTRTEAALFFTLACSVIFGVFAVLGFISEKLEKKGTHGKRLN